MNQANRVLNLAKLTATKNTVIPVKTATSRQILDNVKPLIMTFLTIIKYHLAGTTLEINRMGSGRFSSGNIKPLNKIVGIIKPINEISKATRCESVTVEMSKPKAKEQITYKVLTPKSKPTLPFTGKPKTKTLINKIEVKLITESNK